jgi:membrane associated rhomboid family serine protease
MRHEALVLHARGLRAALADDGADQVLLVPAAEAERAAYEVERYRAENAGWPPREAPFAPVSEGVHAALAYVGLLALMFHFQVVERFGVDWERIGLADARAILGGEPWRAWTALTLHADLTHLAGNAVLGALMGWILAQSTGVAVAWWGFVIAGGLGNLANALILGAEHRSLGASTAVFGMLGLQAAFEWTRRRDLGYRRWRRWASAVMGVTLLAWLGAGGAHVEDARSLEGLERIDVTAHALGFAVGALLGLALGFAPPAALRLSAARQGWLAASAALALALAWALAIAAR